MPNSIAASSTPFTLTPNADLDALATHARSTLLTYLAIRRHANRAGRAWPLRATIAQVTRLSFRSISRATATLERIGLIVRIPRRGRSTVIQCATVVPTAAPRTNPQEKTLFAARHSPNQIRRPWARTWAGSAVVPTIAQVPVATEERDRRRAAVAASNAKATAAAIARLNHRIADNAGSSKTFLSTQDDPAVNKRDPQNSQSRQSVAAHIAKLRLAARGRFSADPDPPGPELTAE